jgi:hypothetical protein
LRDELRDQRSGFVQATVRINRSVVLEEVQSVRVNLLRSDRGEDRLHMVQVAGRAGESNLIAQVITKRTVWSSVVIERDEIVRALGGHVVNEVGPRNRKFCENHRSRENGQNPTRADSLSNNRLH